MLTCEGPQTRRLPSLLSDLIANVVPGRQTSSIDAADVPHASRSADAHTIADAAVEPLEDAIERPTRDSQVSRDPMFRRKFLTPLFQGLSLVAPLAESRELRFRRVSGTLSRVANGTFRGETQGMPLTPPRSAKLGRRLFELPAISDYIANSASGYLQLARQLPKGFHLGPQRVELQHLRAPGEDPLHVGVGDATGAPDGTAATAFALHIAR